jgi:AcrR family transcriptional regulator
VTIADARRDTILDHLADHVLAHGLAASSLRPLAAAVKTSDRMLLYYFGDKASLIAATLERVAARLVALLDARVTGAPLPLESLIPKVAATVTDPALWPYMCLWLEIATLAARGDAFYRQVGADLGQGFLDWGAAQIDSPTHEARTRDAATLLVMIEGILLLRAVGLGDIAGQAIGAKRSIK